MDLLDTPHLDHPTMPYRQLHIQWNVTLILLSYVVSLLGAYAASQVCCQSSLCRRGSRGFLAWNLLAAILFGLCSVWSLHFLAMLAAQFEVQVSLSPGVTILSAFIAVCFTWLALVSDAVSAKYLRRKRRRTKKGQKRSSQKSMGPEPRGTATAFEDPDHTPIHSDPTSSNSAATVTPPAAYNKAIVRESFDSLDHAEAQPLLQSGGAVIHDFDPPLPESEASPTESPPPANLTNHKRDLNEASQLRALAMNDTPVSAETTDSGTSTPRLSHHTQSFAERAEALFGDQPRGTPDNDANRADTRSSLRNGSSSAPGHSPLSNGGTHTAGSKGRPSFAFFARQWSSGNYTAKHSAAASSTDLTYSTDESSDKGCRASFSETASSATPSGSSSTGSNAFVRSLPLTRRERLRLKSGTGVATGSMQELLLTLWGDLTVEAVAKAVIWAVAVCAMHYSGMSAFHVAEGYTRWNLWLVALSYIIAFVVCLIGILFMPNMEVHIGRQLAFSVLAASGVFAMHYTGMMACTFYSSAAATDNPGYPPALGFCIIGFTIVTCLVSTTLVSHAATLNRNKLVEMIHVKQQLWRTLAQKEAVEATVALQTEFTSVAAHELRTPLYTITGYIDLLSRTQMDEEQAMYIETVRRACHTIQLITTNVLDFTRLERANDEEQARPVLLELRSFIYNLAEITEDRGPRLDAQSEGLELIIDIADNVPEAVYLDETYLTRVIMNLLNNAMKFCTSGYLRLGATATDQELRITVTDTGIGIPERFLERIFEPFRQADTSLTRVNNGSGLGLAICKRLVARLNGDISVTSKEGEGSTFLVALRNVTSRNNPTSEAPVNPYFPSVPRSMMVITCSTRVQKAVEGAWAARGYTIHPRSLEKEDLEKVDFIWTDVPTVLRNELALLDLIKNAPADKDTQYPYLLVAYSAETELLSLPLGARVIAMKRPLAIHSVAKILDLPKKDLPTTASKEKPKLVRFASIQSSTHSEGSDETIKPEQQPLHAPQEADPSLSAPVSAIKPLQSPTLVEGTLPVYAIPGKKTILLVEDNLINSKLGQRMLTTLGYHVLLAYDGLQAVETVKKAHGSIHAILMDCQMPVMNGEESTKEIRKYEAENGLGKIAIMALSANVNKDSSNRIMDAGADGFLGKPISLRQLDEALKYIDSHISE